MTDYSEISRIKLISEIIALKEQVQNLLDSKEELKKKFSLQGVVASLPVVEIDKIPKYLKDVLDYVNESLPNKIKTVDIVNRIHLAKDREALLNR